MTVRIYHDSVVEAQGFARQVRDEGHEVVEAVGGGGPWFTEFEPVDDTHYSHEFESY